MLSNLLSQGSEPETDRLRASPLGSHQSHNRSRPVSRWPHPSLKSYGRTLALELKPHDVRRAWPYSAALPVGTSNRSSCCSATPPFRLPSAISEPVRTRLMRQAIAPAPTGRSIYHLRRSSQFHHVTSVDPVNRSAHRHDPHHRPAILSTYAVWVPSSPGCVFAWRGVRNGR